MKNLVDEKHLPYIPWSCDKSTVTAFQALEAGTAEPSQQKRVLDWLIHQGCKTYDMDFFPGGEEGRRLSDFAAGRRFVGQQIIIQLKFCAALINETKEESTDG